MPQEPSIAQILELFAARGRSQYGGEAVTQLQHALQSASLAEAEDAPAELIAAALLHDVGHLLHHLPDNAPDNGVDDHHENSAGAYLRSLFPDEVTEPIRLHVAAKRYLCTVDQDYQTQLNEPSLTSLRLQGGVMSSNEVAEFEQNPHFRAAVRLRRWDDLAKDPQCVTPWLAHYEACLRQAARAGDALP